MGYLICEKCGSHYKLQKGESIDDFHECECGGKLKYVEKLDLIDELITELKSEDYSSKDLILKYGKAMAKESVNPLLELLDHPDSKIRLNVIETLGWIGYSSAIKYLQPFSNSEDDSFRIAANRVIIKIKYGYQKQDTDSTVKKELISSVGLSWWEKKSKTRNKDELNTKTKNNKVKLPIPNRDTSINKNGNNGNKKTKSVVRPIALFFVVFFIIIWIFGVSGVLNHKDSSTNSLPANTNITPTTSSNYSSDNSNVNSGPMSEDEYLYWTGDFGGKMSLDEPSSYYLPYISEAEQITPPARYSTYHNHLIKWTNYIYKMQEAKEKGDSVDYQYYADMVSSEDSTLENIYDQLNS